MKGLLLSVVGIIILLVYDVGCMGEIRHGGADKYEYKHFELENGARVVLVRSDDLEKYAVSVAVDAGSNKEPSTKPGLAHFLEHMLFMGSEKYPEENEFGKYIVKKGGYTNAYTARTSLYSTTTLFQMDLRKVLTYSLGSSHHH